MHTAGGHDGLHGSLWRPTEKVTSDLSDPFFVQDSVFTDILYVSAPLHFFPFLCLLLCLSVHQTPGPPGDQGVLLESHLEFAPSVELLKFPLGGVHVGEASSLPQDPGMVQGLADTETLSGVQDNQLTDLTKDQDRTESVYEQMSLKIYKVRSLKTEVLEDGVTHQVLGIQRHLVPPRRHKLVVAVEDAAVHVLVPPRIEERFKATEPEEQHYSSQLAG